MELAENGDLQRIHDKWLMKNACTLENAELESDRLHLKSFWGLFLICGVACVLALFLYFVQIIRQLYNGKPSEEEEDAIGRENHDSSSLRSTRLQRFLSLMDEKEDVSKAGSKKRKIDGSVNDNSVSRHSRRLDSFNSVNPLD